MLFESTIFIQRPTVSFSNDDSHKICIKYYRKNLKDNIILMTKHSFGEFTVIFRYEKEVPGSKLNKTVQFQLLDLNICSHYYVSKKPHACAKSHLFRHRFVIIGNEFCKKKPICKYNIPSSFVIYKEFNFSRYLAQKHWQYYLQKELGFTPLYEYRYVISFNCKMHLVHFSCFFFVCM